MPRILRAAFAAFALLLSLLVMPALAGAADTNPNGAQVTNFDNDCVPYNGFQWCRTGHIEGNKVTTPSGNQVFIANGRLCQTYISPTC